MKLSCVIAGPVDTYSGYGAKQRDLCKAIIELKKDEWNIKLLSLPWGLTSVNFIKDNKEKWGFLKDYIYPNLNINFYKPDIWIQNSVASEFNNIGSLYNIGVCSGVETTAVPADWLMGVNKMNMTMVSSEHAKKTFTDVKYTDPHGKELKLEKRMDVLFEGCDLSTYKLLTKDNYPYKSEIAKVLDKIDEQFCFLFVGHWLPGIIGEDRKNVGLLIHTFLEAFKGIDKPKPALVLKISKSIIHDIDKEQILGDIHQIKKSLNTEEKYLPNIYLLYGELSDDEMNILYNHNKIKLLANLTKGEGYGRPIAEFAITGKPIIISGWSGHLDYLNPKYNFLINGQVKQIHPSVANNILLKETGWFSPDINMAKMAFKEFYKNYNKYHELSLNQRKIMLENFSYTKMKEKLSLLLNDLIKEKSTNFVNIIKV